ncbi:MAG: histidine kinase [Lachnospiraceae bacterium]|nr:histidine kinase [Lachnospiraceae bacterium]
MQLEMVIRLSITLIFVIMVVSYAATTVVTVQYNKVIVSNVGQELDQKVSSADYLFEDSKTPLAMIANFEAVKTAMKKYDRLDARQKAHTMNELNSLMQYIASFKDYISDLIIVGKNGFTYNLYNEDREKYIGEFEFENQSWFTDIRDGKKRLYYVGKHGTEYYQDCLEENQVYSVVLPVYSIKSKVGYVICDISAESIDGIISSGLDESKARINVYDQMGNTVCELGNMELDAEIPEEESQKKGVTSRIRAYLDIIFARGNLTASRSSSVTGWTLRYFEPYFNLGGFIRNIFLIDLIVLVICIILVVAFAREMNREVVMPLKNIRHRLQKISELQNHSEQKSYNASGYIEISVEIDKMIQDIEKLIKENYLYEIQQKDAQISILMNQLSPHFLFNTLQLIEYQSMRNNQSNVTDIIGNLSNILRYSLQQTKLVPLYEELNYIRSYFEIYCIRFSNKFSYDIHIDDCVDQNQMVPKMIMEPVVENSIKHGFVNNLRIAHIGIEVCRQEERLYIVVYDNGRGISSEELEQVNARLDSVSVENGHIGLTNVNSIIKLQYGNEYGIHIDSREGKGTIVRIEIPTEARERET